MHPYTHKINQRSRSLRMSINQAGEVIVTTPKMFFPKRTIDAFVEKNAPWIEEQLAKLKHVKDKLSLKGNEVLYFGKVLKVSVDATDSRRIGVEVHNDELLITPVTHTKESIQKSIERFLKSEVQNYVLERTHEFGKKMSITFNNVSFKTQKTRWGSCSSTGNLNFNTKLIHSPKEVVDYVIIHELAHRKHMDHSANFWKLVEQYCPEYRKMRGWLKRNGMALG